MNTEKKRRSHDTQVVMWRGGDVAEGEVLVVFARLL